MKLSIYSLKGVEFEGETKGINVKTTAGEITVLDHHLPIISVLAKGKAVIFNASGKQEININGGFLEMAEGNHLSLLID
ncbi:MAG: hypothetical protein Q7S12_02255 [bacterium]|nr:hypothetical protein [bacterium]